MALEREEIFRMQFFSKGDKMNEGIKWNGQQWVCCPFMDPTRMLIGWRCFPVSINLFCATFQTKAANNYFGPCSSGFCGLSPLLFISSTAQFLHPCSCQPPSNKLFDESPPAPILFCQRKWEEGRRLERMWAIAGVQNVWKAVEKGKRRKECWGPLHRPVINHQPFLPIFAQFRNL